MESYEKIIRNELKNFLSFRNELIRIGEEKYLYTMFDERILLLIEIIRKYRALGSDPIRANEKCNLADVNNSICKYEGCKNKTVDIDNLWCDKHDREINC